MSKLKISVIISADSDNELFINCLKSIVWQSYDCFEIIIMDTGNTGNREKIATKILQDNFKYFWHEKEKRCNVEYALNRNVAANYANGNLLLFAFDNVIFDKDLFKRLAVGFSNDFYGLFIMGNKFIKEDKLNPDIMLDEQCYIDKQNLNKIDYSVFKNEKIIKCFYPWGISNLLCYAISKPVFVECQGYDGNIGIYASSDAELVYKVFKANHRIMYPADMYVYIQKKTQYPIVRWRASGGEYIAYRYNTKETNEWFSIKQLEKNITDYNRYHEKKIMLSRRGERNILNSFSENNYDYATIIIVDKDLHDEILDCIKYYLNKKNEIYLVSVLPQDNDIMEKIAGSIPQELFHRVHLCGWRYKKEWLTLCKLLKMASVLKLYSKLSPLANYITQHEKFWNVRKQELEQNICENMNIDIIEPVLQIIKVSHANKEKSTLGIPYDKLQYEKKERVQLKILNFNQMEKCMEDEGYSLPPRAISFRLTYLCNLRCKMCGQWGENGIYKGENKNFLNQYLSIDKLKQIIDETEPFRPGMYYIWGGEPMMHPEYIELIQYIKSKKIFCTTTTNGMFLKKFARKICEIGTEFIRISIDGTEKMHNYIRGNENCYQTVLEGIKAITKYKKKMGTTYPILECDSVIIPDNYEYIEDYLEVMNQIEGINSVNFSHPVYSNKTVGKRQVEEYEKEFGITPTSWEGFTMDMERLDTEKLIRIISRVQNKKYKMSVNFDPPMRNFEDIRMHYNDIEELYKNRFCTVPWLWVEIHPDGKVSFCEDFCDYYIGDFHTKTFIDIWNSDEAREYRKVLLKRNKFPVCSYCGLLCHDSDF